jgi:cobalamin biosynthesis protein CbiD
MTARRRARRSRLREVPGFGSGELGEADKLGARAVEASEGIRELEAEHARSLPTGPGWMQKLTPGHWHTHAENAAARHEAAAAAHTNAADAYRAAGAAETAGVHAVAARNHREQAKLTRAAVQISKDLRKGKR